MHVTALAIQHSILSANVQFDSTEALSCLPGNRLDRSAYGHLMAKIKELMRDREFIGQKLTRD